MPSTLNREPWQAQSHVPSASSAVRTQPWWVQRGAGCLVTRAPTSCLAATAPIGRRSLVMVDAMRGRFTTWTRVRVNLQHVPDTLRPAQEPLDPDEDMASDWTSPSRRRPSTARKES